MNLESILGQLISHFRVDGVSSSKKISRGLNGPNKVPPMNHNVGSVVHSSHFLQKVSSTLKDLCMMEIKVGRIGR